MNTNKKKQRVYSDLIFTPTTTSPADRRATNQSPERVDYNDQVTSYPQPQLTAWSSTTTHRELRSAIDYWSIHKAPFKALTPEQQVYVLVRTHGMTESEARTCQFCGTLIAFGTCSHQQCGNS